MVDEKHTEWCSGGVTYELTTECNGLNETRCCTIHDADVDALQQTLPPDC